VSIESIAGPRRADAPTSVDKSASADTEQTRARLTQLASEFESMLLLQMLKEMRKSASWDEPDQESGGYGAETMLETIDVELASHLSKVQGFGLAKQLLRALGGDAASERPERGSQPVRGLEPTRGVDPRTAIESDLSAGAVAKADSIEMPDGQVTSAFGWRRDPIDGAARFHRGIDIRAAYGQDIQAVGAGRVVSAGSEGGYGETVVVEHAGGLRTRYAHLSAATVVPGQEVAAGQVLGRAGRSGRATGTHLHFEVTTAAGDRVDPAIFTRFKADGVVADLTGATRLRAFSASAGPAISQETGHDESN
jgi:murein DD-endopeptidase MepM/ murein hydrolase activator NlpD